MNVKFHTPKTLKAGSGLSSVKQFLLALLATTISIVLTFGTAAVIDNHKKNQAKKEMVLMVINDFDKTIGVLEKADTALIRCRDLQLDLANHPEHFDSVLILIPVALTWINEEFTETTENIFSTSIETFNTIGNVNFVNEVSSFYLIRHKYKEMVLDQLKEELEREPITQSRKSLLSVSFPDYFFFNRIFLNELKASRDKCVQMMNLSEEDIVKFSKQQMTETVDLVRTDSQLQLIEECESCKTVIEQAMLKIKD